MWWNDMTTFQQAMFIIACAATAILIIQIILMIIGGASGSSFDGSTDGDIGGIGDGGGDISIDTDLSLDTPAIDIAPEASDIHIDSPKAGGVALPFGLRLLSLRSIIAFVAIGGWVGYTLGYLLDWYFALIIAVVCGLAAACCMAGALVGMEKLQSNGNINPTNAVGKIGTVYLTVPKSRSGRGKVNVLVQERYAEYEAITDSDESIPTATEIIVTSHIGANVLLVEKHVKPSITIEQIK